MRAGVPSLESLALDVVAAHVTEYDELSLLPYGGCAGIVARLARSGRLSARTLGPLLRSWSFFEEHEETLGAPLAYAAATCPALASVAARFLAHQSTSQKTHALPDGTRRHGAASDGQFWADDR